MSLKCFPNSEIHQTDGFMLSAAKNSLRKNKCGQDKETMFILHVSEAAFNVGIFFFMSCNLSMLACAWCGYFEYKQRI